MSKELDDSCIICGCEDTNFTDDSVITESLMGQDAARLYCPNCDAVTTKLWYEPKIISKEKITSP